MELKDRVKAARTHAGLTQGELVERIKELPGVDSFSQQALTKLEGGDSKKSAFLAHIAMVCGVDSAWLATGLGEMERSTSVKELPAGYNAGGLSNARLLADTKELDPEVQEQVEKLLEALEDGDISKERFLSAAKLLLPEMKTPAK